jgi:hypothetical protein
MAGVGKHLLKSQITVQTLMRGLCGRRTGLSSRQTHRPKPVQEWIQKQGKKGTHADITYVDVPVDVTNEEFEEIMDPGVIAEQAD